MSPTDDDGPVVALGSGRYRLSLSDDEGEMVARLLGELRDMITADPDDDEVASLLTRLFPPASVGDEEANDEYLRLMGSELLESKLSAFETVETALDGDRILDEAGLVAFMQSINSIRLVLGVMLQVSDDPDAPEVMPGFENSREYHLYGYLSWLLEWTVQALQR